jgi:hypothetical protein
MDNLEESIIVIEQNKKIQFVNDTFLEQFSEMIDKLDDFEPINN